MLDPKGDLPWNEEPVAQDISHLSNQKVRSTVEIDGDVTDQ